MVLQYLLWPTVLAGQVDALDDLPRGQPLAKRQVGDELDDSGDLRYPPAQPLTHRQATNYFFLL